MKGSRSSATTAGNISTATTPTRALNKGLLMEEGGRAVLSILLIVFVKASQECQRMA